ncbi:hypothetical protein SESBI_32179 [Sesbania bispinosa]|nr:hypothetical protein SESBI_32179 [Sesbania bispinosa]
MLEEAWGSDGMIWGIHGQKVDAKEAEEVDEGGDGGDNGDDVGEGWKVERGKGTDLVTPSVEEVVTEGEEKGVGEVEREEEALAAGDWSWTGKKDHSVMKLSTTGEKGWTGTSPTRELDPNLHLK